MEKLITKEETQLGFNIISSFSISLELISVCCFIFTFLLALRNLEEIRKIRSGWFFISIIPLLFLLAVKELYWLYVINSHPVGGSFIDNIGPFLIAIKVMISLSLWGVMVSATHLVKQMCDKKARVWFLGGCVCILIFEYYFYQWIK
jgi:hypothetical protein